MKLYHATSIENMESIIENGLIPQKTIKSSHLVDNKRILAQGVFGFTTLEDALNFGRDNIYYDDVIVFEFQVDEAINDPEYNDNVAMFVETDNPIIATLIYKVE